MKIAKTLLIISIAGLLLQLYVFVNLSVSYKDEVSIGITLIEIDDELTDTQREKRYAEVLAREQELDRQWHITKVLFWIFLVSTVASIIYYIIMRKKYRYST